MTGEIGVLIVEDDFMVARLNKEFTEKVEGFRVTGIAKTAAEAREALAERRTDLIILDVYLPDSHGIEFLKAVRRSECPVDVILITAAHDVKTIEESMRYGVFDYIIKPFDFARYRESLVAYRRRREALRAGASLDQASLDETLAAKPPERSAARRPKGINPATAAKILEASRAFGPGFCVDDFAGRVDVSRITIHRYLEYLTDSGVLSKEFRYRKVGRPQAVYSPRDGATV